MPYAPRIALAAAFAAFSFPALASEAEFLKRFDGSFSGSGQVRLAADGTPHNISCKLSGASTSTSININGTCNASIVSRRIGASLKVGSNGVYSGTYTGANAGTAAVSGRRKGNTVVLSVKWPKPVNGERTATMILTNSGSGLSLSVVNSSKAQMTQVSLSRGTQVASLAQ